MKTQEFKNHFAQVAKRVEKLDPKYNQLAVGFKDVKLNSLQLLGYFHKTRLHKTRLSIKDFAYLRYFMPAGKGIHYAEGEICQNGVVIKKVLILKEVRCSTPK